MCTDGHEDELKSQLSGTWTTIYSWAPRYARHRVLTDRQMVECKEVVSVFFFHDDPDLITVDGTRLYNWFHNFCKAERKRRIVPAYWLLNWDSEYSLGCYQDFKWCNKGSSYLLLLLLMQEVQGGLFLLTDSLPLHLHMFSSAVLCFWKELITNAKFPIHIQNFISRL